MDLKISIERLFEILPDSQVEGSTKNKDLKGVASLESARQGDLSFLGNPKYKNLVQSTNATLILLPEDYDGSPKDEQIYLRIKDPSKGLASVCSYLEKNLVTPPEMSIHPTAWLDKTAKVANGVTVGAFAFIGKNVQIEEYVSVGTHCHVGDKCSIGKNSYLHPGVKLLSRCDLGKNVILNAGVVIGSEGYGFDQVDGVHHKIPHLGKVVVEDDVEI